MALVLLVERPLLRATAGLLGPEWYPAASQFLDCLALAASGWVAGRLNRQAALPTVLIFAATLLPWDFGELLSVNVPWLLRLIQDSLGDSRYVESLVSAAANQAILFGSLMAGGLLSRPRGPVLQSTVPND